MMSREKGQVLESELEHIRQSIQDIITTPIGSRVMRREYGSLIFELLDQPMNDSLVLKCYSALYTAISRWENRIIISQIFMSSVKENGLVFDIEAVQQITGQPINLNIPLQLGAAQ